MALEKDGVVFNYIADGNKNITQLIDMSSGSIANRYDYSPFGQLSKNNETVANPFRFSSEYAEKETGLIYYNYRYYNPVNGKWLKRDPIQEKGGENIYGFVNNQPISNTDHLGHGVKIYFRCVLKSSYMVNDCDRSCEYACIEKDVNNRPDIAFDSSKRSWELPPTPLTYIHTKIVRGSFLCHCSGGAFGKKAGSCPKFIPHLMKIDSDVEIPIFSKCSKKACHKKVENSAKFMSLACDKLVKGSVNQKACEAAVKAYKAAAVDLCNACKKP
ncbi:RHS repeat-associated core domain-containing protein [Lentisphaerota bacterium WC36G]|nr:RHS repeat-associated core domain-containing protein [Lentisphaerae bacterium WC36]